MTALELDDVRKVYRSGDSEVVALDHSSLTVADDEMVALVGPSGSGKTTLLSIAGGLLTPTDGTVTVTGERIDGYSSKELTAFRGENIGFVFQAVNLVPFLNARENLTVVAEMRGSGGSAAKARAEQLLDELGLGHRMKNLPDQLSGGERQRVAIGRALMNEPKLVLFDEPTSALDSKLGVQVMELIRSEIKGRNTAAIIVTHDTR
ncbi:MAG: ABC transporter ATP-binding protein, partial [Acidimicrobiales bacterium]